MSPGRRRNQPPSCETLLDDPELVRLAPLSAPRGIRRRQNFDLQSGLKDDHKVAPITLIRNQSDGPRRRGTLLAALSCACQALTRRME